MANFFGMSGGYSAPTVNYSNNPRQSQDQLIPIPSTPIAAAASTAGPAANMGNLAGMTTNVNAMNVAGQQAANAARIPGATGLEALSSKMIEQQLKGQLGDVTDFLGQQAAERGIATGTYGSPNTGAAYLRALGLNSLDLQEKGQRNLTAAYGRNPAAPLFDPTTQMITPYQSGQLDISRQGLALEKAKLDRDYQLQLRELKNQEENQLYARANQQRALGQTKDLSMAYQKHPYLGTVNRSFDAPIEAEQQWYESVFGSAPSTLYA